MIKFLLYRVIFTSEHTLHILSQSGHAYFLSAEVSSWFWESDLLQTKLRLASKSIWGRLLREQQAQHLFEDLRRDENTRVFLRRGRREITLYNLEE